MTRLGVVASSGVPFLVVNMSSISLDHSEPAASCLVELKPPMSLQSVYAKLG